MKRAMPICVLILLTGCAYDQAYRYYANETYPPRDRDDVEVLHDNPTRVGVSFGNVVIRDEFIDAADNSTRAIAMVPASVHESGEPIEWEIEGADATGSRGFRW